MQNDLEEKGNIALKSLQLLNMIITNSQQIYCWYLKKGRHFGRMCKNFIPHRKEILPAVEMTARPRTPRHFERM